MQRNRLIPLVIAGVLLSFGTLTATAQNNTGQPIVLNDSTPGVDVVVSPKGGAQGVVYLETSGVHVQLLDSTKTEVLSLTDGRVRGLAIQIPQGTVSETLHLDRFNGVPIAQALIIPQATMPAVNIGSTTDTARMDSVVISDTPANATAQLLPGDLSAVRVSAAPTASVSFTTTEKIDMLSVLLPAQGVIVQITDPGGAVLFTSVTGSQINGLAVQLAPGQYQLDLTNLDLDAKSETVFTLSSGPASGLKPLPQVAAGTGVSAPSMQPAANGTGCMVAVKIPTANVRSGPGTAYRVMGSVVQDNTFPVGGTNRQGGWLLIASPVGPAWIATSVVSQSGTCSELRAFDLPLLNAVAVKPVVVPANPVVASPVIAAPIASNDNGGSSGGPSGQGSQGNRGPKDNQPDPGHGNKGGASGGPSGQGPQGNKGPKDNKSDKGQNGKDHAPKDHQDNGATKSKHNKH